jgi:toxin ParE1/3/4
VKRIVILRRADRDLIEHADYIAQFNLKAARRFQRAAEKAFQSLLAMPGMGGLWEADQAPLRDLRVWPIRGFEKYIIFYRSVDKGIEIVRVLHAAQDIEALFEQP